MKQHAARVTRIASLIAAIKEQQTEMQTLARRIAELQEELNRELALTAPAVSKRRAPTSSAGAARKVKPNPR